MNPRFRCPNPYAEFNLPQAKAPHFMTSEGLMMPRHMQPPPMYGPRGATIPPKYLANYGKNNNQQEEQDYYCELCDYDFTSKADYNKHVSEHKPCTIDQCRFVAHPDILSKHVEQQHKTGLYDKLKNVVTPEEILKWREERKKRYPTQKNVALRQQLQAAKFTRGERLSENKSRFGAKQDRDKCRQNQPMDRKDPKKKKNRRGRRATAENNYSKLEVKSGVENAKVEDDYDSDTGMKKFKGTSLLLDYERPKMKRNDSKNALSCLAGLYGSDDDDESNNEASDNEKEPEKPSDVDAEPSHFNISSDEEDHLVCQPVLIDILSTLTSNPTENTITNTSDCIDSTLTTESKAANATKSEQIPPMKTTDQSNNGTATTDDSTTVANTQASNIDSEDDDQQVEVPFKKVVETFSDEDLTQKNTTPNDTKEKKPRQRNRRKRNPNEDTKDATTSTAIVAKKKKKLISGLVYSRLKTRPQNTMLEKLLHADIVHERNLLLQCVRYVVENNFFGIGQENKT